MFGLYQRFFGSTDERTKMLLKQITQLSLQVAAAETVILRGVALMDGHQIGQWDGVRAWLEQDTGEYE